MGQVYVYAIIAVILMAAMFAGGYVIATERRYHIEDRALDFGFIKKWCAEQNYSKEQTLAVFESMYEILKRMA